MVTGDVAGGRGRTSTQDAHNQDKGRRGGGREVGPGTGVRTPKRLSLVAFQGRGFEPTQEPSGWADVGTDEIILRFVK